MDVNVLGVFVVVKFNFEEIKEIVELVLLKDEVIKRLCYLK